MCIKPFYQHMQCHHTLLGPMIPCRKITTSPDDRSPTQHPIQADLKRIPGKCPDCQRRAADNQANDAPNPMGGQPLTQQASATALDFIPGVQAERAAAELLGMPGVPGWCDRASMKVALLAERERLNSQRIINAEGPSIYRQIPLEDPPGLSLEEPAQPATMRRHEKMSRAWIEAQDALSGESKDKGKEKEKAWESPVERQQRETAAKREATAEQQVDEKTLKDASNKKRVHSGDNMPSPGPKRQSQGPERISDAMYQPIQTNANAQHRQYNQTLALGDLNGPTWSYARPGYAPMTTPNMQGVVSFPQSSERFNMNTGAESPYSNVGWRLRNNQLPEGAGSEYMISPESGPVGGTWLGRGAQEDDLNSVSSMGISPSNQGSFVGQGRVSTLMGGPWSQRPWNGAVEQGAILGGVDAGVGFLSGGPNLATSQPRGQALRGGAPTSHGTNAMPPPRPVRVRSTRPSRRNTAASGSGSAPSGRRPSTSSNISGSTQSSFSGSLGTNASVSASAERTIGGFSTQQGVHNFNKNVGAGSASSTTNRAANEKGAAPKTEAEASKATGKTKRGGKEAGTGEAAKSGQKGKATEKEQEPLKARTRSGTLAKGKEAEKGNESKETKTRAKPVEADPRFKRGRPSRSATKILIGDQGKEGGNEKIEKTE